MLIINIISTVTFSVYLPFSVYSFLWQEQLGSWNLGLMNVLLFCFAVLLSLSSCGELQTWNCSFINSLVKSLQYKANIASTKKDLSWSSFVVVISPWIESYYFLTYKFTLWTTVDSLFLSNFFWLFNINIVSVAWFNALLGWITSLILGSSGTLEHHPKLTFSLGMIIHL